MRRFDYSGLKSRMSRLLTTLLLYRSGYEVGKYISLEAKIAAHKDSYYEALELSQTGWHDNATDATPFIKFFLGTVACAYRDMEERLVIISPQSSDTVAKAVERQLGKFSKRDILALCPSVSATTVERRLKELTEQGRVERLGRGKSTMYVKRTP